jgi:hypothetical protein
MAGKRPPIQDYPPEVQKLIAEGVLRPAQGLLWDELARIGLPPGPITDAGTRALQEQRADRV